MIESVTADRPSFRSVEFQPGFNVVLADRTKTSGKKDSRNGLGKSSLIEVIHFCLGASLRKGATLASSELKGWTFTVSLRIGGQRVRVSRNTGQTGVVQVSWPDREERLRTQEWTQLLGRLMFGVTAESSDRSYAPSFRDLISYVARRGTHAYSTPFESHPKQPEWSKQVSVAFLLGLSWEDAADWQELRDRKRLLDDIKRAATEGLVGVVWGSHGELEADRVRLESLIKDLANQLQTFRVHPQYRQLEEEATALTREIHVASNENVTDRNLLRLYEEALAQEGEPALTDVAKLYAAAGVELPGIVRTRLEETEEFHRLVVHNRRGFLKAEVAAIHDRLLARETSIQALTAQRAERLETLRTHGALEEYTKLQQRLTELISQLRRVEGRLADLTRFEEGSAALRARAQQLYERARQDYEERKGARERAIKLFNANSEALYAAPGRLVIDVVPTGGFRFGVEIERSGARGIESMKVFCFDVMVAELWRERAQRPGFLIHDSTLLDPVDERQRARALQLAAAKSKAAGFQYICTMNSDQVPTAEFDSGFSIDAAVRLRLTDKNPEGGLFGLRF
ncbi:MAG: DUF2326 domain-containing protein [Myxococcota bacterium]